MTSLISFWLHGGRPGPLVKSALSVMKYKDHNRGGTRLSFTFGSSEEENLGIRAESGWEKRRKRGWYFFYQDREVFRPSA